MKTIYKIYLPSCLFDSADYTNGFESLSEQIAKALLVNKLKIADENLLKRGNEKYKEPDYVFGNTGYEVTFALSNTLIKQLKGLMPLTAINEFNEDTIIKQIEAALKKKSRKHYAIPTIPVIFSLLPNIYWDTDIKEPTVACLDDIDDFIFAGLWQDRQEKRNNFFTQLFDLYINQGIFSDIYILSFTTDNRYILYSILDFHHNRKFTTHFGLRNNPLLPYCRIISVDRGEYFDPIQNFYKIEMGIVNLAPHKK